MEENENSGKDFQYLKNFCEKHGRFAKEVWNYIYLGTNLDVEFCEWDERRTRIYKYFTELRSEKGFSDDCIDNEVEKIITRDMGNDGDVNKSKDRRDSDPGSTSDDDCGKVHENINSKVNNESTSKKYESGDKRNNYSGGNVGEGSKFRKKDEDESSNYTLYDSEKYRWKEEDTEVEKKIQLVFDNERVLEALFNEIKREEADDNGKVYQAIASGSNYKGVRRGNLVFVDIVEEEVIDKDYGNLVPQPFHYRVLPLGVYVETISNKPLDEVKAHEIKLVVKKYSEGIDVHKIKSEMEMKMKSSVRMLILWEVYIINDRSFANFLRYTQLSEEDRKSFRDFSIPIHEVSSSIDSLMDYKDGSNSDYLLGMKMVKDDLRNGLTLLADKTTLPRGILLYGPPGTGKTTIVKKLLNIISVKEVCRPLAGGDFAKPLQGQAEKMINILAERAALVPWQLCALVVDEIESLVVRREDNRGSSSRLSVILSRIDGISDIPNLLFFAATNHPEMMDAAFMRRMKVKIFVGSLNLEGRKEWIERISEQNEELLRVINGEDGRNLKSKLLNLTLNFTSAQMKGMLERINLSLIERNYNNSSSEIQRNPQSPRYRNHPSQKLFNTVENTVSLYCEQEGILLSQFVASKLIGDTLRDDCPTWFKNLEKDGLFSFVKDIPTLKRLGTGRIFVDLSIPENNIQVQLATRRKLSRDDDEELKIIKKKIFQILHLNGRQRSDIRNALLRIFQSNGIENLFDNITKDVNRLIHFVAAKKVLLDDFPGRHPTCDTEVAQVILDATNGFMDTELEEALIEVFNGNNFKATMNLRNRVYESWENLSGMLDEKEQFKCFTLDLRKPESVISLFCRFALSADVPRAVLVNHELFLEHGRGDESSMKLFLHTLLQQCLRDYKRCVIIFDLDGITQPRSDDLDLDDEKVMLHNEQLLSMILSFISTSASVLVWCVAFSKNPHIVQRFKNYHHWYNSENKIPCLNCGKLFDSVRNTKENVCGKHTGTLLVRQPKSSSFEKINRERVLKALQKKEISYQDIKWSCCSKYLFNPGGGEIPSGHERDHDRIKLKFPSYSESNDMSYHENSKRYSTKRRNKGKNDKDSKRRVTPRKLTNNTESRVAKALETVRESSPVDIPKSKIVHFKDKVESSTTHLWDKSVSSFVGSARGSHHSRSLSDGSCSSGGNQTKIRKVLGLSAPVKM